MIRKRGKSWTYSVDLGRDSNGKRIRKWGTAKTKREAEQAYAKAKANWVKGSYIQNERLTVQSYTERWLNDYVKSQVGSTSYHRYRIELDTHINPHIGHIPLDKLHDLDIQGLYNRLLKSGGRKDKPLSAHTVRFTHVVLKAALAQAVTWGLIQRNPADGSRPPRFEKPKHTVLDENQSLKLLKVAQGTEMYIPVLLALTTGMRRGEILGLRWCDLDERECTVTINQTRVFCNGITIVSEPKTKQSQRRIYLPKIVVDELIRWKLEQQRQFADLGIPWSQSSLVITRTDGMPLPLHTITPSLKRLLEKAGLPRIRFHDLRHTHATQLFGKQVHPKIVSERLGHSSIKITLDTYTHVIPSMQEDVARQVGEMFVRFNPQPLPSPKDDGSAEA